MSRKRDAPSRWPAEVYDYERRVITDPAVGGLDLRKGSWIHCKWCNTTLALKVVNSYSLASWNTHQKGKKHCGHEQEFLGGGSQPQLHHLQLMRVRRELQQSKQYQARHERDVANVINAMTNLISDQQGDLNSLQHRVSDMMHEIEALKKELERIQQKDQQRRRNSVTDMDIFEKRFRLA
ncbi:hypothetical protein PHYSODRAFT_488260 [Phytophthora sojae]|uniref:Uncharacterized protein n=1 Tax=Phytophthora sojae (strain P6497) TaxID=1094619 RepID=G4Z295_PHYSP|nr:hypothetical protein PHYSODRAFT_488260 [Phytophthora sojae]EGZ19239.1 hypothetical protein PHYSODRAFT_488260 [Phytophthora sojae]|eukprot:XP_009521956.1 hypothetical protein PHYSODRAFT_488260 [Phytophthora sojae]